MSKPTPGEWRMSQPWQYGAIDITDGLADICSVYEQDDGTMLANARILRSSKKMLEALEETTARLEGLVEFLGNDTAEFKAEFQAIEKAVIAIAQARGEAE